MCTLVIRNEPNRDLTADDVPMLLNELRAKRRNYFQLQRSPREYLEVIYSGTRAAIIYAKHGDMYACLNASNAREESAKRVVLLIEDEPTPFPANMVLSATKATEVIAEFCRSGQLAKTVFWIRDGENAAAT